jgi:hypothetical protein
MTTHQLGERGFIPALNEAPEAIPIGLPAVMLPPGQLAEMVHQDSRAGMGHRGRILGAT